MKKEELISKYYENNAYKLREMVKQIIKRNSFTDIFNKDMDDFYSVANEVFAKILKTYDGVRDFNGYLYSCLENKIKEEETKRNTFKNLANKFAQSLDASANNREEGGDEIYNILSSDSGFEDKIIGESEDMISEYFRTLSPTQKEIAELKSQGYSYNEICEKLNITQAQYYKLFNDMSSPDKIRKLFGQNAAKKTKGELSMANLTVTSTSEKTKMITLPIISACEQLDNRGILDNHPLQRASGQWSKLMQSNLISDVLQENAIPALLLSEQYIDGVSYRWLLDGKQRLVSTIYSYLHDGFKVSRNVERNMISYQSNKKDEEGNIICNKFGLPEKENCEFDIKNKKFSQLPPELQDRFRNYNLQVTLNMNCTKEQIEYDIRRYNQSKPMSVAQKGITYLGEDFSKIVKALTNKPFFKEKGNYSPSEFYNGKLERTIIESIMAINFLKDWNKSNDANCTYLKENAKVKQFDHLEEIIDRLYDVSSDEVKDLFDSKTSFIWFTLFDRFTQTEIGESEENDEKFVEFLTRYKQNLKDKEVKGVTTGDIDYHSGTKGKAAVHKKLDHIETLMNEFLGIEKKDAVSDFETNEVINDFVDNFCNTPLMETVCGEETDKIRMAVKSLMFGKEKRNFSDEEIQEYIFSNSYSSDDISSMELYSDALSDWSINVDNNSKIFSVKNIPVLTNIVSYVYDEEISEDDAIDWFTGYVENYGINEKFSGVNTEDYSRALNNLYAYLQYKNGDDSLKETA